jgi:hypothetical protein
VSSCFDTHSDFFVKTRQKVREAIIAAFDLLGEKEKGGIFRDDYEYTNDEASYGNCLLGESGCTTAFKR